jgi:hypothetical protein
MQWSRKGFEPVSETETFLPLSGIVLGPYDWPTVTAQQPIAVESPPSSLIIVRFPDSQMYRLLPSTLSYMNCIPPLSHPDTFHNAEPNAPLLILLPKQWRCPSHLRTNANGLWGSSDLPHVCNASRIHELEAQG